MSYLSLAARNSAEVETAALQAGLKKGGAAKGELVLAIFELANCYFSGLGVDRDPVAARKYYETAAQLGDMDALEQVARCYEQGIGGRKDKVRGASSGHGPFSFLAGCLCAMPRRAWGWAVRHTARHERKTRRPQKRPQLGQQAVLVPCWTTTPRLSASRTWLTECSCLVRRGQVLPSRRGKGAQDRR